MGSFAKGREFFKQQQAMQRARSAEQSPVPCEVIVAVEEGKSPKIVGVALSVPGAVELSQLLKLQSQAETESSSSVQHVRVPSVILLK